MNVVAPALAMTTLAEMMKSDFAERLQSMAREQAEAPKH